MFCVKTDNFFCINLSKINKRATKTIPPLFEFGDSIVRKVCFRYSNPSLVEGLRKNTKETEKE